MSRLPTTVRKATALALGATLLVAGPASAHPYFQGGEVPVDSLATLTLDLAHGCATEAEGEGDATTEVSLEVPEWLRVVEVADHDGYEVELEEDDDGRTEVVTWAADGDAVPAPEFDLDVVAEGEVGEERYVAVFQACDDVSYRWVGTPDEPADDPAVRLTLIDADPDSPPPPEPEPADDDADEADDATGSDDAVDPGDDAQDADEPDPADEADDDGAGDDADATEDTDAEPADDVADEDEELATDDLAAEDDGGAAGWVVGALVLVLLAGVVAWLVTRRGRTAAEG